MEVHFCLLEVSVMYIYLTKHMEQMKMDFH